MSSSDKLSNSFHAAGTNGRLDLVCPGVHPAAQPTVHAVRGRSYRSTICQGEC